jgi:hypothetical protein
MSSYRAGTKIGQADYVPTGDSLVKQFFDNASWIGSSSAGVEHGKTHTSAVVTEDISGVREEESIAEIVRLQLQLLEQRIARLESDLNVLVDQGYENLVTEASSESTEDELTFEAWLAEWQAQEPDSFLSRSELLEEIACYERKYDMSSEELLQRLDEGTVPDNSEIMDWKILLESL